MIPSLASLSVGESRGLSGLAQNFRQKWVVPPALGRRDGPSKGTGARGIRFFPSRVRYLLHFVLVWRPQIPWQGGLPLYVRSNVVHLVIDESAQNNYERR